MKGNIYNLEWIINVFEIENQRPASRRLLPQLYYYRNMIVVLDSMFVNSIIRCQWISHEIKEEGFHLGFILHYISVKVEMWRDTYYIRPTIFSRMLIVVKFIT